MCGILAAAGPHQVEFILVTIAVFFICAKTMGALAEAMRIPSIVGQLCAGILLGNLHYLFPALTAWRGEVLHSEFLHVASELGVIFLLFIVGLETNLADLRRVGGSAVLVALIGVVCPFALGYVGGALLPGLELSQIERIFLGAALTATSVGITAQVLKDCRALQSVEGQTILGAAVFDDILGLMILAVVSGLATGDALGAAQLGIIFGKVLLFFVLAFVLGNFVLAPVIRVPAGWKAPAMMQAMGVIVMCSMAWGASLLGLAPIVGAFMAGILMEETYFQNYPQAQEQSLERVMGSLTDFFLPMFFVFMGLQVDVAILAAPSLMLATVALTGIAVLGKIVAGWGLSRRRGDPLTVGFGMIPRGEVGLVFASVGYTSGVLSEAFFGVIVLVVVLTTVIAPILLRWRLARTAAIG